MKRILLATASVVTLGVGPVFAADLAPRRYTKAPPLAAVYDWTGFYVGVNVGGGVGRNRTLNDPFGFGAPYSFYLQPQGLIGGAQVGYNWQTSSVLGPLVFGVEADIQGSGLKDDRTNTNFGGLGFTSYGQKLDWFGTARGRVGLANGPVLAYVTGGLAYGGVKDTVSQTVAGVALPTFTSDRTQVGWTIGSGVEAALGGNWTGKIEYLYLNLGNRTDVGAAAVGATNLLTEVKQNIFRAGLNYRIGGSSNYQPVVAANWAGFYLGGNLGSATGRDRSSLNVPIGPFADAFNLAPDGIIGGAQAGYNWQVANWVFGVETDFQGSSQKDNKTCVLTCGGPAAGGVLAAYDATLPWLGTVRGRFGYSVGSTLFYVTGGYAYGDVKTKVTTNSFVGIVTTTFDSTKSGWTAGAGIESPFTLLGLLGPNWTTKTEYLYVDLGTRADNFIIGAVPATTTRSVTEHIFRTGLNYHFNSPVVAKY
ncbi:membrane protein [Bradyrhizobium sp. CCBAU 11386]|uniref:outer membrane protein n=1 Tax=Bradyrhizobium sp. CCBAU 11386 TaxID=1630837 RepID=UPI00230470D4|nr:outer membrane beta-barrel protein [Bradyrhizobium sp. CCBAU 11386]MDA9506050.1 membrane protein [Bradyrhizobium sp. CCBAU 11386]